MLPWEKRFKGKRVDAMLAEMCWWSQKIAAYQDANPVGDEERFTTDFTSALHESDHEEDEYDEEEDEEGEGAVGEEEKEQDAENDGINFSHAPKRAKQSTSMEIE